MSQTEVCGLRRIRTWPVRVDPPSRSKGPQVVWIDSQKSHRFGLLTDPLGSTGFMRSDMRTLLASSQYPVFKVQAQRGHTLLVVHPTVNTFFQPILRMRLPCSGRENASVLEASERGRPPWLSCPLSD